MNQEEIVWYDEKDVSALKQDPITLYRSEFVYGKRSHLDRVDVVYYIFHEARWYLAGTQISVDIDLWCPKKWYENTPPKGLSVIYGGRVA